MFLEIKMQGIFPSFSFLSPPLTPLVCFYLLGSLYSVRNLCPMNKVMSSHCLVFGLVWASVLDMQQLFLMPLSIMTSPSLKKNSPSKWVFHISKMLEKSIIGKTCFRESKTAGSWGGESWAHCKVKSGRTQKPLRTCGKSVRLLARNWDGRLQNMYTQATNHFNPPVSFL